MALLFSPFFLRLVGVLALVAALVFAYHRATEHYREQGREEVRTEWDAEKAVTAAAAIRDASAALGTTAKLNELAALEKGKKDAETNRILRTLAADVAELRQRPSRNSNTAGASGSPTAGTGAGTGLGLSREDSEFLAGEAARADTIRIALKTCYAQYDAARNELTLLRKNHGN